MVKKVDPLVTRGKGDLATLLHAHAHQKYATTTVQGLKYFMVAFSKKTLRMEIRDGDGIKVNVQSPIYPYSCL